MIALSLFLFLFLFVFLWSAVRLRRSRGQRTAWAVLFGLSLIALAASSSFAALGDSHREFLGLGSPPPGFVGNTRQLVKDFLGACRKALP